jgi:PAS domain S-box-containing protein
LDYSGMPAEQFMHRGWEEFAHPADYPTTAEAFYHAIETGASYQGVMRLRRAHGEFRWHVARSEPLRDRQGRIVQWYGLAVDIDERKKAEDQLRRSEAYLAEVQRLTTPVLRCTMKRRFFIFQMRLIEFLSLIRMKVSQAVKLRWQGFIRATETECVKKLEKRWNRRKITSLSTESY